MSDDPTDVASGATDIGPTDAIAHDPSLRRSVEVLRATLTRKDLPRDFSDESLARMLELQADYVEELGIDAIRRARRNKADVVSAEDFEQADRSIRAAARGRAWIEALGGIFAGAGTGTFLQIAVEDNPSTVGLSVAAIVGLIGFVVTTAALAWRR
jgi:hypothetical protein